MSDNGFTDLREQLTGELLDIRYIPLSQAVLWDENPKEHDLGALAEAFARYGFADPPKYDAQLGALVYGNGRTHALQLMHKGGEQPPRGVGVLPDGEWAIPVKFGVDAASRNEARAFAIDHNNLTMVGGEYTALDMARMWDGEQYLAVLSDLAAQEVAAVTVDGDDLDFLLRELAAPVEPPPDPGAQVDRAAALQAQWRTERAQVWEVESKSVPGRSHRIMCGDSTDMGDVARLMAGEKAGAVVTDPPYAFGLGSTGKLRSKSGGWFDMMNNASWFTDRIKQWSSIIDRNGPIWMFCNWRTLPIIMRAAYDANISLDSVMVWYKNWIGPGGPKALRPTYELIGLMCLGEYTIPTRDVEDFINVPYSSHKEHGHKAEKPAELIAHLIKISGITSLFEPFLGSGTATVAAEALSVICYAMEAESKYVAVALQRLADMGLEPRLVEGS